MMQWDKIARGEVFIIVFLVVGGRYRGNNTDVGFSRFSNVLIHVIFRKKYASSINTRDYIILYPRRVPQK